MVLPKPVVVSDFFPVIRYRSSQSMGKRTPDRRSAGFRVNRVSIRVSAFSKHDPNNESVRNLLLDDPILQVRDGMKRGTSYGWNDPGFVLVPARDSRAIVWADPAPSDPASLAIAWSIGPRGPPPNRLSASSFHPGCGAGPAGPAGDFNRSRGKGEGTASAEVICNPRRLGNRDTRWPQLKLLFQHQRMVLLPPEE